MTKLTQKDVDDLWANILTTASDIHEARERSFADSTEDGENLATMVSHFHEAMKAGSPRPSAWMSCGACARIGTNDPGGGKVHAPGCPRRPQP